MNRTDFYKRFADEYDKSQKFSKETCIAVFGLLSRCIDENDRVYIKGLGTFKKKAYKEHKIANPHSGEPMIIPAGERIVFEPFNGSTDEE